MKSPPGPPMTLGNAANAKVRLIVWCKTCGRQVEPDPVGMFARYGADTAVLNWRDRLVCSGCGGRQVDMVVTGTSTAFPSNARFPSHGRRDKALTVDVSVH